MIHCQDAKAAVFEKLCDKFLQSSAFESMEKTHVSIILILILIVEGRGIS